MSRITDPTAATDAQAPLCLRLLGLPRLLQGDDSEVQLAPHIAPVLALVALRGRIDRAELAGLLYPNHDAAGARRNLRQLLHRRRDLVDAVLEQHGERMQLRPGVVVDALGEPGADAGADAGAGRLEPLLGSLRYDDMPQLQAWLDDERSRRLAAWLDGLASRAALHEREGRLDDALALAERIALEQPATEHAHRRLMRLHYLRDDRPAALAAFDACERVLKDELGAKPGAETMALLAQIERAESAQQRIGRAAPPTVLRPPMLIGRSREWRALESAWQAGAGALVTGQPGLGKTRLLADFAHARGGEAGSVVRVSARPGDERLPQALLSRLLRSLLAGRSLAIAPGVRQELARLLPEYGESEPGRGDASRFVNAIVALFDGAIAGGLEAVFLDDLQFADDASLDVAQHLAAHTGLRWFVAFRDVELGEAARHFVAALSEVAEQPRVALSPLGRDDVHALVASLGVAEVDADTWADALHRRTGGNPLFLLETIKAVLMRPAAGSGQATDAHAAAGPASLVGLPAPGNVGELIEGRIRRLSADAVRLARCAAIAGQDFSAALAGHVLGTEPLDLADGWRELEAAQVFGDGAFAHDLVYEAALASVPGPIARELHAKIARYLAAMKAPAVRIAPHADAAALWQLGSAQWRLAGEAAERAGRQLDAAAHFGAAAIDFEHAGADDDAFRSWRDQAEALVEEGIEAPAQAALDKLVARARTPRQHIAASRLRAYHLDRCGNWPAAIEECRRGFALLEGDFDPSDHLRIACIMASACVATNEPEQALAALRPCEVWARAHGSALDRMHFAGVLGQALESAGQLREAAESMKAALGIARAEQRMEDIAMLTGALSYSVQALGDTRQALVLSREAAALVLECHGGRRSASLLQIEFGTARWLMDLGDYAESIRLLEAAIAEYGPGEAAAGQRTKCEFVLALNFVQLGQFARARRYLPESDAALTPLFRAICFGLRCELARAQGGPSDLLREEAALVIQGRSGISQHLLTLWRHRLLAPEEAARLLDEAIAWAGASERNGMKLGAHVCAAAVARKRGDAGAAAEHARLALRLGEDHHAVYQYRGELYLEAALALDAAGDPHAARGAVESGMEWMRVAFNAVPGPFRASFLERNPCNVQLLDLARRDGMANLIE